MTTAHLICGLAEAITDWWLRHDLFDPCGVFTTPAIFIESYAIRGALHRVRWLEARRLFAAEADRDAEPAGPARANGLAEDALVRHDVKTATAGERLLAGAYAFCDRVLAHQGVQGPPEALMMGYGLQVRDGMVQHACVADQASIAAAVLETVALRPKHPRAAAWQAAIERWADWVIANFAQPNGGIGVGIFCHKWNPISEYWCATSLFSSVLFKLARLTGKAEYERRGLASLDWLARFDHNLVEIPRFTDCAPEVVLYSSEGIVEGIRHLVETRGIEAARRHPAAVHFAVMAKWLVDNQAANGRWPEPPERGYRAYSAGIPWVLFEMDALIGPEPTWRACAERYLAGLAMPEGEHYYGLFVRPFTTGLAWLSACTAAGEFW